MNAEHPPLAEHALGVTGATPAPLILALHGRGGSPGLPDLGRVDGPCRVLLPRGPHRLAGGYAWSRHTVASRRGRAALASEIAEAADRLAPLLERAQARTLGGAVIHGESQGAMVGLALALRHPALVSGAVLAASWLPPALEPTTSWDGTSPRIRAVHRERDPIVPLAGTHALFARLAALGLDVELRIFSGRGHAPTAPMRALAAAWIGDAVARARSTGTPSACASRDAVGSLRPA